MVTLNRAPGLTLEKWNVGLLDISEVSRPSSRSTSSALNWEDLALVFCWQMTERELSLLVRLQA